MTLAKLVEGVVTPLPGSETIEVVGEGPSTKEDRAALSDFEAKLAKLQNALTATEEAAAEAGTHLSAIRRAIDATPSIPPKLREDTLALQKQLEAINRALRGDAIWRSHNEGVQASIADHAQAAVLLCAGLRDARPRRRSSSIRSHRMNWLCKFPRSAK